MPADIDPSPITATTSPTSRAPRSRAAAKPSPAEIEVELRAAGLTLHVPADRTLLEVLHAHNVDVQCDCEEGLCGSCEVPVATGDIEHRDSVLSPAERAPGDRMMSCCSRARSGHLVLDL